MPHEPYTALCQHSESAIAYRGMDLVRDLLGRRSFTDVAFEHIVGHRLTSAQLGVFDAILVALMEHGFTPSAISARMVYMSSPESLQSAVAAGLLAVGSRFIGTMEDCARHLEAIRQSVDPRALAVETARSYRAGHMAVPGFGHHLHKPDDPRAVRLLELAAQAKVAGPGVDALGLLGAALDEVAGKHITVNATGATAAILSDLGVPVHAMRGFAVISRAAGLVAHLVEERETPSGRFIWDLVDRNIPYRDHAERGPST